VKTFVLYFIPFFMIFATQMLLAFLHTHLTEAGLDEAGRGCFAGPVYAAAVILPKDFYHPLLNDSKKLNEKQRDLLRPIIEKESIAFAVAAIDNDEIDKINILTASFTAMHGCIDKLSLKPEILLVDGNRFTRYKNIPHHCIVEGDGKYAPIAAASILAKTYRDEYMQQLHHEFPYYGWDKNKGYGTLVHRDAIASHGLCKYHRKSFNIFSEAFTPVSSE
jgi:ribonuclease HII